MRIRMGMVVVAVAVVIAGVIAGTVKAENSAQNRRHLGSYSSRVLEGTANYGPCVKARETAEGSRWFADMVSDTYDDGIRRTVAEQVAYVREGCKNTTEGV